MIAVDSSALLAILLNEPERQHFREILERDETVLISTATLVEARMVAYRKAGQELVEILDAMVADFEVVPPDWEQAGIAQAAFVTYGKGGGHPAQLNYGDLFSYALAKSRGVSLLFKGDDFAATDIEVAG